MARGEFGPLSGSRQASKSRCDSSSRGGDRPPTRTRAGIARSSYGTRLVLDVPAATIYRWPLPELAEKYVQSLPEANAITVCAIYGLSTRAEAQEASRCLEKVAGRNVLLVTSDYHTRRAVAIFRHEIPRFNFSVAAAHDPREFGAKWWQHREWAKTNFNEWMKLLWWEAVDRWR